MSTAGKVLIGLSLLVIAICVILVSGVAQLNASWKEVIQAQQKQFANLEESVAKNQVDITKLKDQIVLLQVSGDETATVLRAKLTDVERARAEAKQIEQAVKNQLDSLNSSVAQAEAARDRRTEEKQAEIKAKADAEQAVNTLKSENSDLMTQLTQLRQEFKTLLETNKTIVNRASGARPVQRAGRPG